MVRVRKVREGRKGRGASLLEIISLERIEGTNAAKKRGQDLLPRRWAWDRQA